MKNLKRLLLGLFLVLSFVAYSAAQVETGTLAGTVTDPSGAVVPGARITVTNTGTGLTRTLTSNAGGSYTVVDLPPGNYEVTVESANFQTYKRTVAVNVGSRTTVDAAMVVGAASTVVEVTAEGGGVQVNTQDQQISNTVTSTQITQLPSLTRNPYDFVLIGGNVAGDPNGSTGANGVGVSLNGQRSASTEITLDGNQNSNLFGANVGQKVPLDSVQEYKVITNTFSAQYGRASGGIVNVATKSGTNQYHGTVYEFNRVSTFAANTYQEDAQDFAARTGCCGVTSPAPADHFTRNQFGYSVGGPVTPKFHDKLFFFSSTEWTRIRSVGNQFAEVLTPQFLALTSPTTQNYFNLYGKTLNATPTGQTLSYTDLVPVGSTNYSAVTAAEVGTTPIFQNVLYKPNSDAGAGSPENAWSTVNRIDWNVTDKTTFFGRYAYETDDLFSGFVTASPYAGYNTGETDHNHNVLLSATHIFSPTILSSTKVAYQRLFTFQPLNGPPTPTLYFDNQNTTSFAGGTQIALPGYTQYTPGNGIPFGGPQNLYEFDEDLSMTRGSHTFRFGGTYIHVRDNRLFGAYENPVQVAGATSNADSAIQGLLQGILFNQAAGFQGAVYPQGKFPCPQTIGPSGATPVVTPACEVTTPVGQPSFERNNRFNDFAAYFQDDWKATPKLTLNLGVRWEYYGPQHNANPALESNFYLGSGSNVLQQIRNGFVATTPNSPIGSLYDPDYKDFAPRVGFAYDPIGDGKWAIRGGYGIAYERNFGNVTYNVIQNPPNYAVLSLIGQCPSPAPPGCTAKSGNFAGGLLPIQTSVAGPLAGSGQTVALPPTSLRAVDPHIKTAYASLYSFSVEHEVIPNTVLALEYSGSRGIHQYGIVNVNKQGLGSVLGDTATNTALNPQYGNINFRDSVGDSYYNAVNVRLQSSNFARQGLELTANYTYSHAMDDLSSTFSQSGNNFNLGFTNPLDPGQDRGNADYDIPNRFVFSGIWQPRFLEFKNSSSLVRNILGGFEFAPIFNVQSGSPFNIYDCTNAAYSCPRVVAAPGLAYSGTPVAIPGQVNSYNYIAIPAAAANPFSNAAAGGASDIPVCGANGQCLIGAGVGKDQFRAPRIWNFTLGAYKNIKLTERFQLQLRGEFYNIFNHHNQYVVTGTSDIFEESEVTTVKGASGSPGVAASGIPGATDERRNVQLGLKIIF